MDNKKCAFTGHRPQHLPFGFNEADNRCNKLKQVLKEKIIYLIENKNVSYFISGMAIGVDMYSAEIVLDLKEKYPNITLECAIPCETQSYKWPKNLKSRYITILEKCDKKTLIQKHYSYDCMNKRNQYIVYQSDFIIAVWNGKPSGTGKTIKYAKDKNKIIVIINSETFNINLLLDNSKILFNILLKNNCLFLLLNVYIN